MFLLSGFSLLILLIFINICTQNFIMIHNTPPPPKHSTNSYFFFPFVNLFPQGVKDFSVPVGLDAKVKVDLVVVGSVAVSEKGNS